MAREIEDHEVITISDLDDLRSARREAKERQAPVAIRVLGEADALIAPVPGDESAQMDDEQRIRERELAAFMALAGF